MAGSEARHQAQPLRCRLLGWLAQRQAGSQRDHLLIERRDARWNGKAVVHLIAGTTASGTFQPRIPGRADVIALADAYRFSLAITARTHYGLHDRLLFSIQKNKRVLLAHPHHT